MMNSGPVLYLIYLIFAKKKEKKKFLLFKYICIWWYSGRAVGVVYPDVSATKWDEVVREGNLSLFLILWPILICKDCHLVQNFSSR